MVNRLIVFGGSAGSLAPLREVLQALPPGLAASVLCVRHMASTSDPAAELLQAGVGYEVRVAVDGEALQPGVVWLAAADQHLLVEGELVRVVRGPRENNARPAIDVLFRSAAVHYGSRVVAVLLSGTMADGVLGLSAVQRCGGVTVVQDPSDASSVELPQRAIDEGVADHVLPARSIAEFLVRQCARPLALTGQAPEDLQIEAKAAAFSLNDPTATGLDVGDPVNLTCPDCGGALWRMRAPGPLNYRCEVGHGYNEQDLLRGQAGDIERALWVAFRTLKERAALLSDMIRRAKDQGQAGIASAFEPKRLELENHAQSIRVILTTRLHDSITTGVERRHPAGE